jgi:hypothetical protein
LDLVSLFARADPRRRASYTLTRPGASPFTAYTPFDKRTITPSRASRESACATASAGMSEKSLIRHARPRAPARVTACRTRDAVDSVAEVDEARARAMRRLLVAQGIVSSFSVALCDTKFPSLLDRQSSASLSATGRDRACDPRQRAMECVRMRMADP